MKWYNINIKHKRGWAKLMGLTISQIRYNVTRARHMMQRAKTQDYAVGEFHVDNQELLAVIAKRAQKLRAPVVVNVSASEVDIFGMETFRNLVDNHKIRYNAEIYLSINCGSNVEKCKRALDIGYEFVKIDAPITARKNQNSSVKQIVEYAKFTGAIVESGLGLSNFVADMDLGGSDYAEKALQNVQELIENSGIDILTTAMNDLVRRVAESGTLNFPLLKRINNSIPCYVSLSDISGVSLDIAQQLADSNFNKINSTADLQRIFRVSLEKVLADNPRQYAVVKLLPSVYMAVADAIEQKIQTFGSARKAVV